MKKPTLGILIRDYDLPETKALRQVCHKNCPRLANQFREHCASRMLRTDPRELNSDPRTPRQFFSMIILAVGSHEAPDSLTFCILPGQDYLILNKFISFGDYLYWLILTAPSPFKIPPTVRNLLTKPKTKNYSSCNLTKEHTSFS